MEQTAPTRPGTKIGPKYFLFNLMNLQFKCNT